MFIPEIPAFDTTAAKQAELRQSQLTKPHGSLGRLESLSIQIAGITGSINPPLDQRMVFVMAGDHGVVAEGVSAFPQAVTPQMIANFLAGGAAINALARQAGARVRVVDVGVASELPDHPMLIKNKVAPGTQNMAVGPAMSRQQAEQSILAGISAVENEISNGVNLIATGDMGIGNTTPSAAIISVLTGRSPEIVTGRGTGLDDAALRHKVSVIQRAITINQPNPRDALDILAKIGGFEIGGIAGVIIGAAAHRIPVVVDGVISGAGAAIAIGLAPEVKKFIIPGHQSVEPGHKILMDHLELDPVLKLNLRLGEGTGAVLTFHLVEAAMRTLNEMATFGEAGVSNRE